MSRKRSGADFAASTVDSPADASVGRGGNAPGGPPGSLGVALGRLGRGLATLDAHGRILHANDRLSEILGVPHDTLLGRSLRELVQLPDPWAESPPGTSPLDFAGERGVWERRHTRADGSRAWIRVAVEPERDVRGGIVCWAAVVEALWDDRSRERQLAEAAHVGLWGWDLRTNEVFFSREWKHQLGYEADEIADSFEEWESRLHPEDRDRTLKAVQSFIENPRPTCGFEFRLQHRDGSYRTIYSQASLAYDASGTPVRMLGSHIDITDRKREEDALQAAHRQRAALAVGQSRVLEMIAARRPLPETLDALLRLVESQSPDMLASVLLLDPDGVHVRHGAAPRLPPAYVSAIDGAAIGEGQGSCGTAASRGAPVVVEDIATDPLWDRYRTLALFHGLRACWSTPIFGPDRQVLGTLAMYATEPGRPTDEHGRLIDIATHTAAIAITRQREEEALRGLNAELEARVVQRTHDLEAALARARDADRLKSAFLASMSHELRTPLNSIIGFTGLLLRELPGPLNPEQVKQLTMTRDSARHLLALINDILDLSKIEAGRLEISRAPFDLRSAAETVLQTIAPEAKKKHLSLTVEIDARAGTIVSDRRRVEQVMLNLLSNAVKFTEQGGVSLVSRARPGSVEVSVADTGIGIAAEDLERAFRPFRQLDGGLDRRHEGTGLGLPICRRLVELLGGVMRVDSDPGRGSTFTFTLPAV